MPRSSRISRIWTRVLHTNHWVAVMSTGSQGGNGLDRSPACKSSSSFPNCWRGEMHVVTLQLFL